jgi:SAM-dependent methyltransferase
MKILVCIANYGLKNNIYVKRLIEEYSSFTKHVDIVILSDILKNYGDGIDIHIGLPNKNPRSLPFGWKKVFYEKLNDYDIFIYTEDDTLITENHLNLFIDSTKELPEDKILGFLRYEVDKNGNKFCSSIHSHYHWKVGSVEKYGNNFYAHFTNLHGACFILTRKHLKKCLKNDNFMRSPCVGQYDMQCTAATEPYTVGGLEKVINISEIEKCIVHHLPNQYLDRMGIPYNQMHKQLGRMIELGNNENRQIIPDSTNINDYKWEKIYYGKDDDLNIKLIPQNIKTVLFIGIGIGRLEDIMLSLGLSVDAIPLDMYMSVLLEEKGIRCFNPCIENFNIENKYDLITFSDILSYYPDNSIIFMLTKKILADDGVILIRFNNFNYLKNRFVKLSSLDFHKKIQYKPYTFSKIKKELTKYGFSVNKAEFVVPEKLKGINLGPLKDLFSKEVLITAKKI